MQKYILIICEKPQAARRIAYAIADVLPAKKNFHGIPYWELKHKDKRIVVASAAGHLFGLQEKKESNEWPVFDVEWKASKGFHANYISALRYLTKNASEFVIACDYDIEGELIGYNVLRFICKTEKAKRMKFSTLTKKDLIKSFENMEETINYGQAYAGETRHYLDWFYGINLSRGLMQAIRKTGVKKILSIGRVQGPALSLIVAREKEIKNFTPEKYWNIYLIVEGVKLKYKKEIKAKEEAEKFLQYKNKKAKIETKKETQELEPLPPFDLTTLQIESFRLFGFSPAYTLKIAQNLYLRGLISYPRTSSQKLPPTIGAKGILEKLKKQFSALAKFAVREKPIEGKKTDPAHPAIFPTGEYGKLSKEERKVYELIVKRFISCFSENALIERKKIIAEKDFMTEGKRTLRKGWLEVYPLTIEIKELPDLDGTYTVEDVIIEEKETQPPKRFTPASIIAELEKRKLGTKATRAEIIEKLYKRGYISGIKITATNLGIAVVDILSSISPLILDEKLTRDFEEKLQKIEQEKNKEKIIKKQKEILEEAKEKLIRIAKDFKEKESKIGEMLIKGSESFSS
ncbi:MAG: DNA topoisomerase I [Candidatus Pacearchaeota archaeon]|nr:DNA topoisomerase I [Candidatus Pacearchaeota archaeon]